MKELVIRFGKITEQSYNKLISKLDTIEDEDYLINLNSWLHGLKSHEYYLIKRVYQMPPSPECWDNYLMMGVVGLREQNLMDAAGTKFKEAWRKRPVYVKKKKSAELNTDETGPE